jgi:ABC-type dipeptide/oligopeptide/nickel transport system ATPase component
MANIEELQVKNGIHGAIVGQTGTGKSVLARQLLPIKGNLIIVDPKRMFDSKMELPIYHNPKDVLRDKPKRFIYRPSENLLTDMGAYDVIYRYGYKLKNVLIYTDDVVGVMDRTHYPHHLQVCYQMGRAYKVSMLSAFQRPFGIPQVLLSECCKFFVFRLAKKEDRKRIDAMVPGYDGLKLPDKHTFAYYNADSDTEFCIPHKILLKGGK